MEMRGWLVTGGLPQIYIMWKRVSATRPTCYYDVLWTLSTLDTYDYSHIPAPTNPLYCFPFLLDCDNYYDGCFLVSSVQFQRLYHAWNKDINSSPHPSL